MRKLFSYFVLFFISLFSGFIILKADSASIRVSSSSSKVVVGNTFTVTVNVSSGVALGTYEYTLNYDANLVKLTGGSAYNVWYPNNSSTKSNSKTFTFKAIGSGTSTISVKSYNVLGYVSESSLSTSVSGASVKTLTQAELQASYSKNNYLGGLSVNDATISPEFNKDVSNYTVNLGANVTEITINGSVSDKAAKVSGLGTFEVTEGENKFDITVTAENGSERTYTIIATVVDPNPITVTVDGKDLVVVKRGSILEKPESYTETTLEIEGAQIPAFYSEATKYYLIGLKDSESNISLYIYDKDNNSYKKYNELSFNKLTLFIMDETNDFRGYNKANVKIGETEVNAYKYGNTDFYLIYGMNIETGSKNWYQYDALEGTVSKYNSLAINYLNNRIQKFKLIIILLGIESIVLFFILLLLFSKKKKFMRELEREKLKTIKSEQIKDNKNPTHDEKSKKDDESMNNNTKSNKDKKKKKKKDLSITQVFDEL